MNLSRQRATLVSKLTVHCLGRVTLIFYLRATQRNLELWKECLAFHQEHLRRFILKQFYQESHIVSLSGVVVPHHSSINYKKSMPKQPYIFKQYLVQLTTSKSLNRQIGTHFHTSTKKSLLKHIHHVSYQIAPTQIQDLFTLRETKHKPRWSRQFEMERPNKEIARLSLKYRETMLRNAVPNPVKNYENIDAFKSHLKYIHKDINHFTFEKESSSLLNKDEWYHYC